MRKLVLLTAALAVGALGVTGVASAIQGTTAVTVKVTTNKAGTKKQPRDVGTLTVDLTTTPVPGEPPFATDTTVVHLDKDLVFNGKKFPSCTQAQIQQGPATCAKAKVGSGSARGSALGQIENLTVTAYNGPGGNKLELLVVGSAPLVINSVIEGTLVADTGKFGKKLTVDVPPTLEQPLTGVFATLTNFKTALKAKAKDKNRTPYVGLKGCSDGKIDIAVDFKFTDGTTQTATNSTTCKKK